jgi:hypothetical protein
MPHVTVGAENGAVILPYRATAARLPRLIREVKLVTVEGGPRGITGPGKVNTALLGFLISQPGMPLCVHARISHDWHDY